MPYPSKDRTVGQTDPLAGVLAQPWAQAYAASAPQGNLVNVSV